MEEENKNPDSEESIEIDFGAIGKKIKNFFKSDEAKESTAAQTESNLMEKEINISELWTWVKNHKMAVVYSLLLIIILLAFLSRIQNIPHLEGKYLVSPDDPYAFLRYSTLIAEGKLPENDTLRYYPMGVNTKFENLGSAYLAAWFLNFAKIFNPNTTMFDVAAYYAPTLLIVALMAFFFLTQEMFNSYKISLISTGLLAFSSTIFFRTAAGFLEKEPLFLPLLALSLLFFVKAYKEKLGIKLYVYSVLAGIFTGLSGFTSGLFVFILVYVSGFVVIEVLLQKMNKDKLAAYGIWLGLMMVTLMLLTTKYDFRTIQLQLPFAALIFPIVAIFVKKPKILERLPSGIYHVLIGFVIVLIAGTVILGPAGMMSNITMFSDKIMNPAGTDRMTLSVSENQAPSFIGNWITTFGIGVNLSGGTVILPITFIFFFLGGIVLFYKEFKHFKYKWLLTVAFILFICSLLFENFGAERQYGWISTLFSNQLLYMFLFIGATIFFLFMEYRKHEHIEKINSIIMFMLIWFIVGIVAANGAIRLFFMLGLPTSIMAGFFTKWCADWLGEKTKIKWLGFIPYIVIGITISVSFYTLYSTNANMYPGLQNWYEAMGWIKNNTAENAVFTHWWDYGYLVQTMGGRATLGDPGNFYAYRNYDIGGHLFNAFNNSEALAYLNAYHKPDYLVICSEDVLKFFQIARLGSLSQLFNNLSEGQTLGKEAYFSVYSVKDQKKSVIPNNLGNATKYPVLILFDPISGPSQVLADFRIGNSVYSGETTYVLRYIVPSSQNETGNPYAQIFNAETQKSEIVPVGCLCETKVGCYDLNVTNSVPVCALLTNGGIVSIQNKTRNVLFTQLYLLEKDIPGYDWVYSTNVPLNAFSILGQGTNVKIYKYNYTALEENPVAW
jgi:asparagine N-glycosylation enzyme membrane subunit Stt3